MNLVFKYIILIASILQLCSCANDDIDDLDLYGQEAIGFQFESNDAGFQSDVPTRGLEINTGNIKDFGVLAYYLPESGGAAGVFTNASTPGFMHNQKVEKSGSDWGYSPVKYWPHNINDRIKFFAYAPYNGDGIVLSGRNAGGFPTIDYTANTDITKQSDLLVAHTAALDKNNGVVELTFKHALAKLVFRVTGNVLPMTINSITLKGISSKGVLTYNDSGNGYEWTTIKYNATFTITNPDGIPSEECLFMLPQKADNKILNVKLSDGSSHKLKMPVGTNWKAGTAYTYNIDVEQKDVPLFYYSDGTVSKTKISGKTLKGILYWVNDDKTVGKVMSNERKDGWNFSGYGDIWAEGDHDDITEASTNTTDGMINMINVYNLNSGFSYESVNLILYKWVHGLNGNGTVYNNVNQFNTWYFPAEEELKTLFANRAAINTLYDNDDYEIENGLHWSSTTTTLKNGTKGHYAVQVGASGSEPWGYNGGGLFPNRARARAIMKVDMTTLTYQH